MTEAKAGFFTDEKRRITKPGLSRTRRLLKLLGDPQKELKFVHVAGTNGKGSCCCMLSFILRSAGLKVGTYTSPAVVQVRERIKINGREIPERDLKRLEKRLEPLVTSAKDAPTAFEIETAAAMFYFHEKKCDVVVLEAGMGGKDDATNVIGAPVAAVIMNIGLDHVAELGPDIRHIAEAKAGIIKRGTRAVFYGGNEEAEEVIKGVCRAKRVPLTVPDRQTLKIKKAGIDGSVIDYAEFKNLKVGLAGIHQTENAACVIETVRILRKAGFKIDDAAVRKGLKDAKWPARFEVFSKNPVVVYDGAHNVNGVENLLKSVDAFFVGRKITAVMGVMADKDHAGMLELLSRRIDRLYAVCPDNPRSLPAEKLQEEAARFGIKAEAAKLEDNIIEKIAGELKHKEVLLVIGSLYLYKEALPHLINTQKIVKTEKKMENVTADRIFNIAIDGPSGAGKSTVAKWLAKKFKIGYLDTGAMYRTVALFMDRKLPQLAGEVEAGAITPETEKMIDNLLSECDVRVEYDENSVQHMLIGDEDVSGKIRTPLISMEASKVSAIASVRVFLVDMQRKIGEKNSIVMDGRDIGTHVLPNATVKIYLTASAEERARRRFLELKEKGTETDYETVLREIIERDYGDSHRAVSPLRQAEDAVVLDTTDLDLEHSQLAAEKIVLEKLAQK